MCRGIRIHRRAAEMSTLSILDNISVIIIELKNIPISYKIINTTYVYACALFPPLS